MSLRIDGSAGIGAGVYLMSGRAAFGDDWATHVYIKRGSDVRKAFGMESQVRLHCIQPKRAGLN